MSGPPAAKDGTVASLVISNENLRRDITLKENEIARWRKLHEERERKLDDAVSFRASASRELERNQRELDRANKEVAIMRQDKQKVDATLAENALYIKKLEARLTGGGKDFLIEQNTKLKSALQASKAESEGLQGRVADQRQELERAVREIEILATALELRAEELSLKGDLKSGLLYEVATRREEVKKLQAELGARIERAATIEFEAREATLRADKLATDAAQLGTTVSHLTRELDAAMQKVSALEQELEEAEHQRDVSLDYVSEQAGKVAEAMLKAEEADRAAADASKRAALAEESQRVAEMRAAQYSQVQQVTHAALQAEKHGSKDVMERAGRAERQLLDLTSKYEACRSECADWASKHAALQAALAGRDSELRSLRDRVGRLTDDVRRASEAITRERQSSDGEDERMRVQMELLSTQLSAAGREREELQQRAREANARVTALLVENARLADVVTRMQAELAHSRTSTASLSDLSSATSSPRAYGSHPPLHAHQPPPPALNSVSAGVAATPAASATTHMMPPSTHTAEAQSPSMAAAALVKRTLRAAGLDDSEADHWFPHAAPPQQQGGARPAVQLTTRLHTSAREASGDLKSPGTAALQAALDKARARREGREASSRGLTTHSAHEGESRSSVPPHYLMSQYMLQVPQPTPGVFITTTRPVQMPSCDALGVPLGRMSAFVSTPDEVIWDSGSTGGGGSGNVFMAAAEAWVRQQLSAPRVMRQPPSTTPVSPTPNHVSPTVKARPSGAPTHSQRRSRSADHRAQKPTQRSVSAATVAADWPSTLRSPLPPKVAVAGVAMGGGSVGVTGARKSVSSPGEGEGVSALSFQMHYRQHQEEGVSSVPEQLPQYSGAAAAGAPTGTYRHEFMPITATVPPSVPAVLGSGFGLLHASPAPAPTRHLPPPHPLPPASDVAQNEEEAEAQGGGTGEGVRQATSTSVGVTTGTGKGESTAALPGLVLLPPTRLQEPTVAAVSLQAPAHMAQVTQVCNVKGARAAAPTALESNMDESFISSSSCVADEKFPGLPLPAGKIIGLQLHQELASYSPSASSSSDSPTQFISAQSLAATEVSLSSARPLPPLPPGGSARCASPSLPPATQPQPNNSSASASVAGSSGKAPGGVDLLSRIAAAIAPKARGTTPSPSPAADAPQPPPPPPPSGSVAPPFSRSPSPIHTVAIGTNAVNATFAQQAALVKGVAMPQDITAVEVAPSLPVDLPSLGAIAPGTATDTATTTASALAPAVGAAHGDPPAPLPLSAAARLEATVAAAREHALQRHRVASTEPAVTTAGKPHRDNVSCNSVVGSSSSHAVGATGANAMSESGAVTAVPSELLSPVPPAAASEAVATTPSVLLPEATSASFLETPASSSSVPHLHVTAPGEVVDALMPLPAVTSLIPSHETPNIPRDTVTGSAAVGSELLAAEPVAGALASEALASKHVPPAAPPAVSLPAISIPKPSADTPKVAAASTPLADGGASTGTTVIARIASFMNVSSMKWGEKSARAPSPIPPPTTDNSHPVKASYADF